MARIDVNICGVHFNNPIIAASGTYGFGREYADFYPLSEIGGISCKGTTLAKKDGNPPPRVAECEAGMLNSVGLQNPGVDDFINNSLPWLKEQGTVVISNIAGNTIEDYCTVAEKLSDTDVDMIEMNISCPNVKVGGIGFGTSCDSVGTITRAVKKYSKKPLIVKLSPNVTNIAEIAKAAEEAGADALSLINTLTGMRIDIKTRRPLLKNNTGGYSGVGVLPVAIHMVNQVYRAVKLPIIGMGGVYNTETAVEMFMAGATAIQVGTAIFKDPFVPLKIAKGLNEYMEENKIRNIADLTGSVELW